MSAETIIQTGIGSWRLSCLFDAEYRLSAGHHRVSYLWDADLEQNVAHVVDNHKDTVVGKSVTDAQKDHSLRIRKLVGEHFDEQA